MYIKWSQLNDSIVSGKNNPDEHTKGLILHLTCVTDTSTGSRIQDNYFIFFPASQFHCHSVISVVCPWHLPVEWLCLKHKAIIKHQIHISSWWLTRNVLTMLVILEITIVHSYVASYFINKRQSVDYIDNGLMFDNNSSNRLYSCTVMMCFPLWHVMEAHNNQCYLKPDYPQYSMWLWDKMQAELFMSA